MISLGKFWLVWSPSGRTPPSVEHPTIAAANAEADRLAGLNPGHSFFVLTAESLHVKRDVVVFQLRGRGDRVVDEIPF